MEEILCIGCGATIQTTDKAGLGFTPPVGTWKRFGDRRSLLPTLFPSSSLQWNHRCATDGWWFLKILHEVGDSDALVVNVIDIFDFNGSVIPGLPRFVSGNDVLLVGNKKIFYPSLLNRARLASGWWSVPTKKVFVQSMSS